MAGKYTPCESSPDLDPPWSEVRLELLRVPNPALILSKAAANSPALTDYCYNSILIGPWDKSKYE